MTGTIGANRDARDGVLGRRREELTSPALLLDLDVARRNVEAMAARVRELPVALRPHVKVHKSPELARLQVAAGAIGVTTATAWEALAMAEAGIDEVLVANEVVTAGAIRTVVSAARLAAVTVAADDDANLRDLAVAARQGGVQLGVLVEVDVGMGRCGVRSAEAAARLAQVAAELEGLRFRGLMGYEGHCMLEPDRDLRVRKAAEAMEVLLVAVDAVGAAGLDSEIVSAGGTGTYDLTGANPRITEIQAGSYVVMDAFHASLVPGFEVALTVLATVVSRHGEEVVLDVGRKAIGIDNMLPRLVEGDAEPLFVHEEHSGFRVAGGPPLRVGQTVELLSGYAPTTVNLYDSYHVLEDDRVVDVWPVRARYGAATTGATKGGP